MGVPLWLGALKKDESPPTAVGGPSQSADKPVSSSSLLLLGAEDGILGGLGDAELDHLLGRNLNGLAGRGVSPFTRLAVDQHELSDARDGEGALRLPVGQFRLGFHERRRLLLADP